MSAAERRRNAIFDLDLNSHFPMGAKNKKMQNKMTMVGLELRKTDQKAKAMPLTYDYLYDERHHCREPIHTCFTK